MKFETDERERIIMTPIKKATTWDYNATDSSSEGKIIDEMTNSDGNGPLAGLNEDGDSSGN